MFDRDLQKHAGEFGRYLRNNQYDVDDTGAVHFARAAAVAQGGYLHDVNGLDERFDKNLLPDEGLIYLLSVGLNNGTKLATWYLSLYAANYTPLAGLTAASYPATASEITSNTEGYTEVTRPVWTPTPPTTPLIDNLANKASFTIATASSLTVSGAALLSEATKGAVTGKLISATKFSSARTLYDTDVFNLAYRVQLTST
jgi:hypothetical protein